MKQIIEDSNTSRLLGDVIETARQAANQIMDIYKTDFAVKNKSDQSPLTAADMAAHKTICNSLSKLTPGIPILSEEAADIPFEKRQDWLQYWLVDPLDGTREFIKRNGEFTVNIALIEAHRPILGVVYVPVTKLCYFATKGQGAYKQESVQTAQKIKTKSTSTKNLVIAGSRSHGTEQQNKFIESLGKNTELIALGSSLKFCLVAEGRVDIYPRFGPTSEWDTAAAHCIVEEAGGIVINTEFKPLQYNTKESLVNTNFLVIADKRFDWKPYLEKIEK